MVISPQIFKDLFVFTTVFCLKIDLHNIITRRKREKYVKAIATAKFHSNAEPHFPYLLSEVGLL